MENGRYTPLHWCFGSSNGVTNNSSIISSKFVSNYLTFVTGVFLSSVFFFFLLQCWCNAGWCFFFILFLLPISLSLIFCVRPCFSIQISIPCDFFSHLAEIYTPKTMSEPYRLWSSLVLSHNCMYETCWCKLVSLYYDWLSKQAWVSYGEIQLSKTSCAGGTCKLCVSLATAEKHWYQ